ncbi:hypothetical protein CPAR01_04360 [Colletotrichum paranaense]|uniref:BTB domain-containing protein n=1 Tax=Colletotrichum paranaense TaxID=1914294 RepID=A0ABQ9SXA3_9PEZI|nr:uncharacterized protein CPAR01_04360 [Colletotrichum paranaense]KAK1543727.1 hypothetical protein CPAR01_04360 [Colletotrichum paranaense]
MIRPMLDMRKILNSPQIEYHVGESGKSFSVPKAPNSASITLRDIDEATFTRLVEYAYRQDYTVQGLKARSFASDEEFLREFKGIYVMLDKSIHKEALKTKKLPDRYVRFDTLDAHIALGTWRTHTVSNL